MNGKVCPKCGEFKRYDEFHKNKSKKDGHHELCKVCKSQTDKLYYQKNKEKHNKKNKKYYEENKAEVLRICKEYRENNKETIAEYKKDWAKRNKVHKLEQEKSWRENNEKRNIEMKKKWYEKNRDRVYSNILKRRSLKHNVHFGKIRRKELLDRDNWTCQCCGIKVHDEKINNSTKANIDHIIPISKGGDSTLDNLQVLCRTCNLSKNDKTDIVIEKTGQIKLSF